MLSTGQFRCQARTKHREDAKLMLDAPGVALICHVFHDNVNLALARRANRSLSLTYLGSCSSSSLAKSIEHRSISGSYLPLIDWPDTPIVSARARHVQTFQLHQSFSSCLVCYFQTVQLSRERELSACVVILIRFPRLSLAFNHRHIVYPKPVSD